MDCGIIIIGDEILSGYRQDQHLCQSIQLLNASGHRLRWCEIIGDDSTRIVQTLARAKHEHMVVFCFGGIGATPDDLTRQCAAQAFGCKLERHAEAVSLIEKQFGKAAYPKRIQMAELPEGANLIPNPINNVPGFSVGDIHFMPGFPQMAAPMLSWVLSNYPGDDGYETKRMVMRVYQGHESEFIDDMNTILSLDETMSVSSLPVIDKERNYIDFILTGGVVNFDEARQILISRAIQQNAKYEML